MSETRAERVIGLLREAASGKPRAPRAIAEVRRLLLLADSLHLDRERPRAVPPPVRPRPEPRR